MFKTIIHSYLILLLAFWFFVISDDSIADATQSDGKWTAEAITLTGGCKTKYRFDFEVKNGNVKGKIKGNRGYYTLSGPIIENGTTELGLDGFDAGKFVGVFESSHAEGTWETKKCNGTFTFKKET